MAWQEKKKVQQPEYSSHYFCSQNCSLLISFLFPNNFTNLDANICGREKCNGQEWRWTLTKIFATAAEGCGQATQVTLQSQTASEGHIQKGGEQGPNWCLHIMSTAARYTVAKRWTNPKCPLMDEWVSKIRYTRRHKRRHTGMSLSLEKELNSDAHCHVHKLWKHLATHKKKIKGWKRTKIV